MVTIVLITYNDAADLPLSLTSIRALDPPPEKILAVDNVSKDATREILEKAGVETIVMEENRGFGAAINRALDEVETRYLLVLNPDTRLDPSYLGALLEGVRSVEGRVASATGKVYRAVGEAMAPTTIFDTTGIYFTPSLRHFDRGGGESDRGQFERLEEVFGVSGAVALYDAAAVRAVGGFDESFFMYREDADLAWRLRWAGYRALYVPGAVAYHRRRVTPERRRSLPDWINMHGVKNRYLLRINNETAGHFLATLPTSLPREIGILIYCLTVERSSLKAYAYLWRHRRDLWNKRRRYLANRRVSTLSLLPWFFGRRCASLS